MPRNYLAVRPVIGIITCDEVVLAEDKSILEIPVAFLAKIHGVGEVSHAPEVLNEDEGPIKAQNQEIRVNTIFDET